MSEEWRAVVGYEGLYEISSCGRVRSYHNWGKIIIRKLSPASLVNNRYIQVGLYRDGTRKNAYVHLLLMDAFGPPRPSPEHEVRHLDGNTSNLDLSNLAWGTRKENMDDMRRHGRMPYGEQRWNSKLTKEAVRVIRSAPRKRGFQVRLAERFGVSKAAICMVLKSRRWGHVQ